MEDLKNKNNLFWIIDHETLHWAPGLMQKEQDNEIIVQCTMDNEFYSIEKTGAIEVHPSCLEGVPDLLSLGEFNEGALLHTIRVRYSQEQIYTSIGTPILLSVNPYQKLKIFTTNVAKKYRQYSTSIRSGNSNVQRPEPHLFMVAEESYQDMLIDNKNQSIIISGESGAGKTEATKIVLQYLAKANTNFVSEVDEDLLDSKRYLVGENSIEKQVLDSNPLLEAFGNAKTFKNNNSSRFGKFIQVNFEPSGKIHSANIQNYLLEKSRIVSQQGVERNFHIFFQIMSSPEMKKKYILSAMQNYHYINQSGVYTVPDVDDAEDFKITLNCMKNIGFSQENIDQIIDTVVAILLLGNLEFEVYNKQGFGDQAIVAKTSLVLLEQISKLLQIDQALISKALTMRKQVIGKEIIESPLKKEEAYASRDGMAKLIYGKMFNWLVKKINESISDKMKAKISTKLKFIGLLDIFGFEIFKENSFEQLCINYANEKLQQQFNQHMFTLEQEEYSREKVQWTQIKFVDNQECIDLFEHLRNPSLFKLLDEECMIKGNEGGLLKKYNDMLQSNRKFKKPKKFQATQFIICHYAGEVEYEVQGFLEKNKDTVSEIVTETLFKSECQLLSLLFEKEAVKPEADNRGAFGQIKPIGGGLKGNSLSNQFRAQLNELIVTLKESQPRYIRCIKPNSKFSPAMFDSIDVSKQLSCAGMLEAIRIRKAGYAIRVTMQDFGKRYRAILGPKKRLDLTSKQLCEMILKEVSTYSQFKKVFDPTLKKIQTGLTKVFMKEEVRSALEQAMGIAVLNQAKHIQKLWRGFKARRLYKMMQVKMRIIKHHIKRFMRRRKFRKVIHLVLLKMRKSIKRVQHAVKWKGRHKRVMHEIEKRIERKRREAEEKRRREEEERRMKELERIRKEEEERKRREEEEKRKMQEEVRKQQEKLHQQQQINNQSQIASNFDNHGPIIQQESTFNNEHESQLFNLSMTVSNVNDLNQSNLESLNESNMYSQSQSQYTNAGPTRFQQNLNKLEQFMFDDQADREKIEELEQQLQTQMNANTDLKSEMEKMRSEMNDKDKKIKELTIRLDATRKLNKKDNDNPFSEMSKMDMSIIVAAPDDRMSLFQRSSSIKDIAGGVQAINQEIEKAFEQRDEEISQLTTKVKIMEAELNSKDAFLEGLSQENEELKDANKKRRAKLEQEIEQNSQNVATLTKQIKDLQETNYQLELNMRSKNSDLEKKAIKDQNEEMKKMESQLREAKEKALNMEMQKLDVQEKMVTEFTKLQNGIEEERKKYISLEYKFNQQKEQFEDIEVQLIQKDEFCQNYEEENKFQQEKIKMMQQRLEELGENRMQFQENYEQNLKHSSQSSAKVKELTRELDELKGLFQIKQNEMTKYKVKYEQNQKKAKELEEENEILHDKMVSLKRSKHDLEADAVLLGDKKNNGRDSGDPEKMRLKQKVEVLSKKLVKADQKWKTLDQENNFYHQTTTLFLTIKKIIEKEKKFCYMLALESDVFKKKQLVDGINMCKEKSTQLDNKLKKLLLSIKETHSQEKPKERSQELDNR